MMGMSDSSRDSSPIPWREMFKTAAIPQASIPRSLHPSRSSPALGEAHSPAYRREEETSSKAPKPPRPVSSSSSSSIQRSPNSEAAPLNSPLPTAHNSCTSAMVSQHSTPSKMDEASSSSKTVVPKSQPNEPEEEGTWTFNQKNFHLAIYIAMAHAVLVSLIAVLYGVWILFEDFRKPIQWAVLCSMPLREIQRAMVEFWEKPLKQGMVQTLWAIPAAMFKALIGTIMDARVVVHRLLGKAQSKYRRKVGFSTLMQWLVSFACFTLGYEFLGPASLATIAFVGMIVYAAGTSLGLITPLSGHLDVQATWSILSAKHSRRGRQARSWLGWAFSPFVEAYKLVNTRLTSGFVGSLHFVIALFLISTMIVGSLAGLVVFSYKVALEGKDAVVALKTHVQRSNYAERVGLNQWIEDNKVPDLIDTYTARTYETVSEQIDFFAAQYNMTDLADASKKYILGLARGQNIGANISELSSQAGPPHPVLEKLQNVRLKFRDYDVKGVYFELEQAALILLEQLQISKEDLIDKAKQLGQRWLNVGKQVVASSSTLLTGSTYLLISIGHSIASGAAEVVNFLTQAVVFFSVLYYLIISESGGVMEQVLGMVPMSESTRRRCATVLEDTVSNVLLSTAKAAFFQAAFTWLLFRFFNIHFLYMSTLVAFFSALLSFPSWFQLSSLLAGAQLAVEGRYVQAMLLMGAHTGVIRYGVSAIQNGSPGHFTGLSLAVGVVLFWPSLERAIMGPLFMTLLIAMKNLYLEFVLTTAKKSE